MSILRNRAAAVKTPEQYAQFVSAIPPDARAKFGLPDQYDPAAVESFVAAGIPAEKRAEHEETKRHHREMEKRPTGGAGTIIFGEGGTTYRLPGTPGAPAQVVTDETGKPITKPAAGTGAGGGKELSASVLNELADYDTAQKQLDELFEKAKTENISGAGARANQFVTDALGLQGTDAARFEGASAPVRQGVGTILEGGKLAAGDEGKYKNMLPRYGDSPAVLEEKKKALNKYLATRKAERIKALKAGGYAVPDAGPAASSDSPGQTKVVAGKTYFKKPNGKWAVRE